MTLGPRENMAEQIEPVPKPTAPREEEEGEEEEEKAEKEDSNGRGVDSGEDMEDASGGEGGGEKEEEEAEEEKQQQEGELQEFSDEETPGLCEDVDEDDEDDEQRGASVAKGREEKLVKKPMFQNYGADLRIREYREYSIKGADGETKKRKVTMSRTAAVPILSVRERER